jgi:hypothetical protein
MKFVDSPGYITALKSVAVISMLAAVIAFVGAIRQ